MMKINGLLKPTLIIFLIALLSSCEFLGWDSSGGNNCEITPCSGVKDELDGYLVFLIEAPEGYPLTGSAAIERTGNGDLIKVEFPESETTPDPSDLSDSEALVLVRNSCDSSANLITSISEQSESVTIAWTNQNSDEPELIITGYNGEGLALISCQAL